MSGYQNFFASATNYKRQSPAQTSGKELSSEFRMRNNGASAQVVSCTGSYDDKAGTVTTFVRVMNPSTGEVVFHQSFTCPK
jgi:hypothetical protein